MVSWLLVTLYIHIFCIMYVYIYIYILIYINHISYIPYNIFIYIYIYIYILYYILYNIFYILFSLFNYIVITLSIDLFWFLQIEFNSIYDKLWYFIGFGSYRKWENNTHSRNSEIELRWKQINVKLHVKKLCYGIEYCMLSIIGF